MECGAIDRVGRRVWRPLTIALLLLAPVFSLPAQIVISNIPYPEYYPAPNQTLKKSMIFAKEVRPIGRSLNEADLKDVLIETYSLAGETNLIGKTPQCLYNQKTRTATSTNHLQAWTGDGKLFIEGDGFLLLQTNSSFYISNNVNSRFEKGLFLSRPGPTNVSSGASNQFVIVQSGQFCFNSASNRMLYTGNVRVDDPEMWLTSPLMDITLRSSGTNRGGDFASRSTNGIEQIVWDGGVVATNKATGSRTWGRHAVYAEKDGRSLLTMTGQPHWQDGLRESDADVFVYDRDANWWRAERNAHVKIPRGSMGQFGMFSTDSSRSNHLATNQMVDAYAETFLFQLPPTNGPVQYMLGETNVVILDPENHGRATGGRLIYNETNGIMRLQESPFWRGDQGSVKGDEFIFDRTNQIFTSRGHSEVWFHVAGAGGTAATTNAAKANTNQFIRVLSDVFEHQADWLRFKDKVHAAYLEDDQERGRLSSDRMDVQYSSNQVHRVIADGGVVANQLLFTNGASATIERELRAEHVDVRVRTNSLLEKIIATQNVSATQTQHSKGARQPVLTTLDSELAILDFLPGTNVNVVDTMIAEQNVEIMRADTRALGERAVYTGSNEIMRITGSPTNLPVLLRSNFTGIGREIVYDGKTGTNALEGYQSITGTLPARATNHNRMTNQPPRK